MKTNKIYFFGIFGTLAFSYSQAVLAQSCASSTGYVNNPIDFCSNNPSDPCCVDVIIQNNSELIDGSKLIPSNGMPFHPECWSVPGPYPPQTAFIDSNYCQSRVRRMPASPTVELMSPAMGWNIFNSSNQIINNIPMNYKMVTEVDQLWTTYPQQNPMTLPNVTTYLSDSQPPSLVFNTYYTVASQTNRASTGSSPAAGLHGFYSKSVKLEDQSSAGAMQYIAAIPQSWGTPAQNATGYTPNARVTQAGYTPALQMTSSFHCTNIIPQLSAVNIVFQSRIIMVFDSLVGMTNCSQGSPAVGQDPGNQGICTGTYRRLDPYMNAPADMFNQYTVGHTNYQVVSPQAYVCNGSDGSTYHVFGVSVN